MGCLIRYKGFYLFVGARFIVPLLYNNRSYPAYHNLGPIAEVLFLEKQVKFGECVWS